MEHIEEGIDKTNPNFSFIKEGYLRCNLCKKVNLEKEFFSGTKGNWKPYCRDCVKENVRNDMIKALPFLDIYDIPLLPDIWLYYVKKYPTAKSIFGKYLARLKLCSFRNMTFTNSFISNCEDLSEQEIKNLKNEYIKYITEKINNAGTPSCE